LEVCYAPGSRWGQKQFSRQAAIQKEDTVEMEKVVKYKKKFKLVPIPGTESGRLQDWLQYNVGDLFIDPREAKMTDSQAQNGSLASLQVRWERALEKAQETHEWFMVVRHPVDRLLALCRESQPFTMEPNFCIQRFLSGALRLGPSRLRSMKDYMDEFSVKHVLRYEFLSDDLSNLLGSHNLSINGEWPVGTPIERPNLWPLTLHMIFYKCFEDLERFNYSMPNSTRVSLPLQTLETRPPTTSVAPSVILSVTPMEKGLLARSFQEKLAQRSWRENPLMEKGLPARSFFQEQLAQRSSRGVPLSTWSFQRPKRQERVLKFIHITKTGGTAIEDWGRQQGLLWGRFHAEYMAMGEVGSPWHHVFRRLPPLVRRRYDWFMVVRNPLERVVSEYYCPWTGTTTPDTDTEDAFNSFVQSSVDGSRMLQPGSFRAMSEYLDPSSVQHILRFETLTSDLKRLLPQYGIHFERLPHRNKAVSRKFNTSHLHPKTLRMIAERYAADFKNFNYSRPKFSG